LNAFGLEILPWSAPHLGKILAANDFLENVPRIEKSPGKTGERAHEIKGNRDKDEYYAKNFLERHKRKVYWRWICSLDFERCTS
jgi:hypothetical protein